MKKLLIFALLFGGIAMGKVYLEDEEPIEDEEVIELELQEDEVEEVDIYDPSEDYEVCGKIFGNLLGES